MSTLNDNLDLDLDDEEGEENAQDTVQAPQGVGSTDEGDDPFSDENEYTDEEDEAEAVAGVDYEETRAQILAELSAEGAPTVRGPEAEAEEVRQSVDDRIELADEYEPGAEETRAEAFAEEKARREAAEFVEWSREFSARQKAAREAAQAPPPEALQVEPPSAFERMTDQQFEAVLAARERGDDHLRQGSIADSDMAGIYGQFMPRPDSGKEDF